MWEKSSSEDLETSRLEESSKSAVTAPYVKFLESLELSQRDYDDFKSI